MENESEEALRLPEPRVPPVHPLGTAEPPPGKPADEVYLAHAPLLRRVAIRKFGIPPGEAQALVHDVFLTYLVNPRAVRGDLRAYLIGAICNASRNYWRSRRSEGRVFSDTDAGNAIAGDVFDGLSLNLVVGATLAKLGQRCREVLRRYYLDGDETPLIAAAIHTSASNVNYLMHVCRKRARAIYQSITRVP